MTWEAEAGEMGHWGQPGLGTKTKLPNNEKQEKKNIVYRSIICM